MPLTKRVFNVGLETRTGYVWMPEGTGSFPLVVFFHGMGVAGNWPDGLLQEGPLYHVNKGWKPNFIIVALQNPSWTVPAKLMKYAVDNDTEIKSKWDGKNILWTGLSAGGQPVQDAMALGYPGSFVPLSMAGGMPVDFKARQYKLWAFHAVNDTQCPFITSKSLVDGCNAAFPGSAKLTEMKNPVTGAPDGHGNWNYYYDPNYKEGGKNIYEWGLNVATAPVPAPTPTPTPSPTDLKAIPKVLNITATSATLDGSESTGYPNYYLWELAQQPKGSRFDIFPNGGYAKGGKTINVNNLSPGYYLFNLKIGKNGVETSAPISFTVPSSVQSPVIKEQVIPTGATKVILREGNVLEFV